ncbi:E3 ubiquitin-protein ligase [Musa troglodytarum]|uniref:E3 ubiquitin-protein ligase n=1 Tax=Musa troglodytarum TaxID=320322 RepID=A0A9E7JJL1_9LILI|nr:E3 ubiquitin-protein ligase [Musa troglodytarum]
MPRCRRGAGRHALRPPLLLAVHIQVAAAGRERRPAAVPRVQGRPLPGRSGAALRPRPPRLREEAPPGPRGTASSAAGPPGHDRAERGAVPGDSASPLPATEPLDGGRRAGGDGGGGAPVDGPGSGVGQR